jgi:hypothetical protein
MLNQAHVLCASYCLQLGGAGAFTQPRFVGWCVRHVALPMRRAFRACCVASVHVHAPSAHVLCASYAVPTALLIYVFSAAPRPLLLVAGCVEAYQLLNDASSPSLPWNARGLICAVLYCLLSVPAVILR